MYLHSAVGEVRDIGEVNEVSELHILARCQVTECLYNNFSIGISL